MNETRPKQIEIQGRERNLDDVIEGIIVLDDLIQENNYALRKAWQTWLPSVDWKEEGDGIGRMSYNPVVCMRKSHPESFEGKIRDIPYFIYILNQARERRPTSEDEKKEELKTEEPKEKFHCALCKNITSKGMIISEIDDYYLTPNGFPYHNGASLLINKDDRVKQETISAKNIATWMKASILLDQYIFYNTLGAGASIKEHQHVQVVDLKEMKIENESVQLPILNSSFVGKEKINGDVFRLTDYSVDGLIFTGSDAPYKASFAAHLLSTNGRAYNILINKDEVYVIGRNLEHEVSICIQRKVGGYEISGVALLGDIEEKSQEKNIKVPGPRIFSNMKYEIFWKNLCRAGISLEDLAKKFRG